MPISGSPSDFVPSGYQRTAQQENLFLAATRHDSGQYEDPTLQLIFSAQNGTGTVLKTEYIQSPLKLSKSNRVWSLRSLTR